jgi:hypothetical protein
MAISFVALLGLSSGAWAQGTKVPTLEEMLQRLDASLAHYDAKVPSFICDEHVVSRLEPGWGNPQTVTDSIFRLKRSANADHTTTLVESRDVTTVDGKPATKQDVEGPTLLEGAFEGGLAVVSSAQTSCMNYALEKVDKRRAGAPYVVRFATLLTPENRAGCLLQEESKGRATIDPVSMQMTHLELTTPRHTIVRGDADGAAVVGKRVITVDYAPVVFGGQTFWMPSLIALKATGGSGTFHETVWSYRASYRNFHKLEVTATIRP